MNRALRVNTLETKTELFGGIDIIMLEIFIVQYYSKNIFNNLFKNFNYIILISLIELDTNQIKLEHLVT